MRILLALLVGPFAVLAHEEPSATRLKGPCSVKGVVLNAATGQPVRSATVMVLFEGATEPPTATSDEDGKYAITGLPPGRYILVVRSAGFAHSYGSQGTLNTSSTFVLGAKENSKEFIVRLSPNGGISGRILDGDGNAVAGATVLAYRMFHTWTGKRLRTVRNCKTTGDGQYRLADLAPGTYYIVGMAPGYLGRRNSPVPTYYPGTAHVETAVALDFLGRTDLSNIDVHLAKPTTVCVQIRVDRRIDPLFIMLSQRHSFAPPWTYPAPTLPQEGRYEACGIVPGAYFAMASNYDGYSARQAIHVAERGDREFLLNLPPQADVTGRIAFEGEPPAKIPAVRVRLVYAEHSTSKPPETTLKDSLEFTLSNVNPDRYLVDVVNVPEGYYLKSVRAGMMDVLGKPLEVAGSSPDPLTIVLSPNVGSVHGTVMNRNSDGPEPGAFILLAPDEPERQRLQLFYSDGVAEASGAFAIRNVAPGRYRAIAFTQLDDVTAVADPEFMAEAGARGRPVEVREKSAAMINLDAK